MYNIVSLESFSVFPKYFISTGALYLLIVITLITYNVYGLISFKFFKEQKIISFKYLMAVLRFNFIM